MRSILFVTFLFGALACGSHVEAATLKGPPSNNGLVGYWSFNEGTSTKAGDFSGSGNVGTLTNMDSATDWVAGKFGKALDFDGVNDYVISASSPAITGAGARTMAFWANNANPTANTAFVGFGLSGSTSGWFYATVASGKYYFSGYFNDWDTGVTPTAGWHHHVLTYDGTTVRWYVDGVQLGSGSAKTLNTGSGAVNIGRRGALGDYFLKGSVDDVRIYNRVLSAPEIGQLYRSGQTKFATSQAVVSNGLIGWWTFDGKDMAGGSVFDRGTLGKTGTLSGIATSTFYTLGKIGQAGNFDGVDDYVTLGTNTYVNADIASGTFATWFKLDTYPANDDFFSLFDIEGYLGGQIYGVGGAAKIRVRMVTGATGATELRTGRWYHYAQTWDGTTLRGYLDGVEDVTFSAGSPTPASLTRISTIGSAYNLSQPFDGSIDDVRLYNRTLSADEIRILAGANQNKLSTADNRGLVGYWSFNEGTSTLAGDFSGNGNTGTLTNMDATTDWVVGKVGKALDFDGADDYVTIPDTDNLSAWSTNGEMTVSAWVKVVAWPSAGQARASIVAKAASSNFEYSLYVNGAVAAQFGSSRTATFELYVPNGTQSHMFVSGTTDGLILGKWHHVVGTYNNDSLPYGALYIDGVLLGTDVTLNSVLQNGTTPVNIGRRNDGAAGSYLNAFLDEVRIYNRSLSAAEVLKLYRSR